MSDTAERPAKPAWTRCPKCRQRIFNDHLDIEYHRQGCPADLRRDLSNLAKNVVALVARIEELEQRPVAVEPEVVTLHAEPTIDLEGVASWPDDEPEQQPEPVPAEVVDQAPFTPIDEPAVTVSPPPPALPSWAYGDEDDDEPEPITRPVMR